MIANGKASSALAGLQKAELSERPPSLALSRSFQAKATAPGATASATLNYHHHEASHVEKKAKWSRLPHAYNAHFQPRTDIWPTLEQTFVEEKVVDYRVLTGLGGTGKSTITAQWAREQERLKRFDAIRWMPMGRGSLNNSLEKLAHDLKISTEQKSQEDWLNEVSDTIKEQSWLLIWDNVDGYSSIADVLPYFQSTLPKQHLLMSSRDDSWDSQSRINVGVYTPDESQHYIEMQLRAANISRFSTVSSSTLAERLGYHPLALELAMAHICVKGKTLEWYLKKLEKEGISSEPWPTDKLNYQLRLNSNTLSTLWDIESSDLSEDTLKALRFMSFLSPDHIRGDLLCNLFEQDEDRYDDALRPLWKQSFVKRYENEQQKEYYSIHRLLQEVVRTKTLKAWQKNNSIISSFTSSFFEEGQLALAKTFSIKKDKSDIKKLRECVLHGEQLLMHIDTFTHLFIVMPSYQARLHVLVGEAERILANYASAKSHLEIVYRLCRHKNLNGSYPDITDVMHSLAMLCYASEGNYYKARYYYDEIVKIDHERCNNTDHPNTATTLNNLGMTYYVERQFPKARQYYKQSLDMKYRLFGEKTDHPDIAATLHNLGMLCYAEDNLDEAIDFSLKALEMRRVIYGEKTNHPDIADTLNNLGMIYSDSRVYKEQDAHKYLKEALIMRRAIYGEKTNHPDIADTLHNLGKLHYHKKEYSVALDYFNQACEMRYAIHGKNANHPRIILLLLHLSDVSEVMGNTVAANNYSRQANEMEKIIQAKNTHYTAHDRTLNDLNIGDERFNDITDTYDNDRVDCPTIGGLSYNIDSSVINQTMLQSLRYRGDSLAGSLDYRNNFIDESRRRSYSCLTVADSFESRDNFEESGYRDHYSVSIQNVMPEDYRDHSLTDFWDYPGNFIDESRSGRDSCATLADNFEYRDNFIEETSDKEEPSYREHYSGCMLNVLAEDYSQAKLASTFGMHAHRKEQKQPDVDKGQELSEDSKESDESSRLCYIMQKK